MWHWVRKIKPPLALCADGFAPIGLTRAPGSKSWDEKYEIETWQGGRRGTGSLKGWFHQLWSQNPVMERWLTLIPMGRWVKPQTSP